MIAFTAGLFWVGAYLAGYSTQRPATEAVASTRECPDLSGKYMIQGEDGQVHIFIEQEHCDRVTIRRETGYLGTITAEKHVLKLDGTSQEDSSWFCGTERYKTSAKFSDSALQIQARMATGNTFTMIYSLTPEGDLLEKVLRNGRAAGGEVAKRQK